jgi:hypothetical protein
VTRFLRWIRSLFCEGRLDRAGLDAFRAALREARDAQPDPLVYRRRRKEIP